MLGLSRFKRLGVRFKLGGSYVIVLALLVMAVTIGFLSIGYLENFIVSVDASLDSSTAALFDQTRIELHQRVERLRQFVFQISAMILSLTCLGVTAALVAYHLGARDILISIHIVRRFARAVANGDLSSTTIDIRSGDEFDLMGRDLERMKTYLQHIDTFAQSVARGHLDAVIRPRSRHDKLGFSLQAMAISLRTVVAENARVEAELEIERMRQQMITLVSHEFRTSLGLIKGSVSALRDPDSPLNEDTRREFLLIAEQETDSLSSMVNDILTAATIRSGTFKITPRQMNVTPLIARAVRAFDVVYTDRSFVFTHPSVPVVAPVDEVYLSQAMENLLDNAVKYTPAKTPVHILLSLNGANCQIRIRDHGSGISSDVFERMFDDFARGTANPDQSIRGTGLGLGIVRAVVEAHDGTITVDTETNQGATFIIDLPICSARALLT